jgi:hypothetical protein
MQRGRSNWTAGFAVLLAVATTASGGRLLAGDARLAWDAVARPSVTVAETVAACRSGPPYYAAVRHGATVDIPLGVVLVRDTSSSDVFSTAAAQPALATDSQIGTVYGLAVDTPRGQIYAGAAFRVGGPYGPGGPGAIYQIDLATGAIRSWATVSPDWDHHSTLDPNKGFEDDSRFVGVSGLGDIDLDASGPSVLAVNLSSRRIERFAVPDGRHLGGFDHGAAGTAWSASARPFGLGLSGQDVLHGVVRTDAGADGALSAHVYRSRLDGSEMHQVLEFALPVAEAGAAEGWSPWSFDRPSYTTEAREPMLVDLVERQDGDLILGFRIRREDQSHWGAYTRWGALLVANRHPDGTFDPPEAWASADGPPCTGWCGPRGSLAPVPGQDAVIAGFGDGLRWLAAPGTGPVGPVDGHEPLVADGGTVGDVEVICPAGPPNVLYLPTVDRQACGLAKPLDLVLVLDMSTSMRQQLADGRPKHAAVVAAAQALLNALDFDSGMSRVGVVGFNDRAWVATDLTGDGGQARAAVSGLPADIAEGTRLDLALNLAAEVVHRHRPEVPVAVLLLTDGRPNRVPPAADGNVETTVLNAAGRVQAAGAVLHAVGFGMPADLGEALLRAVAGGPSRYHQAADAVALTTLMAGLGDDFGCGR